MYQPVNPGTRTTVDQLRADGKALGQVVRHDAVGAMPHVIVEEHNGGVLALSLRTAEGLCMLGETPNLVELGDVEIATVVNRNTQQALYPKTWEWLRRNYPDIDWDMPNSAN